MIKVQWECFIPRTAVVRCVSPQYHPPFIPIKNRDQGIWGHYTLIVVLNVPLS